MSTLSLDDDLYQQARAVAAARGLTVDEFVGETLRKALEKSSVRQTIRSGIAVVVTSDQTLRIDPEKVRRSLEEEGF
jgi:hypothetical protein